MTKSVIIVNGCDAKFYPFMEECLRSLTALGLENQTDFGILDLGLSEAQLEKLSARGCKIIKPEWTIDVPLELRVPHEIGLVARTALRDYFPGYETYIWFDADAWAQTPEFFTALVEGARAKGAAVIHEDGTGYHMNRLYRRWWYGHLITSLGLLKGLRTALSPVINIGILALDNTAPHWDAWISDYKKMIERRLRVNMDQHSFNSAVVLNRLPTAHLPARCNWICTLSPPVWNPESKLLCEPNTGRHPISVLHLAGPDKRRTYQLLTTSGEQIATPVDYSSVQKLRDAA